MDSFSMVNATGSYQFKINHSKTKDMCIGEWITSPIFRVGQHDWSIEYYPQGDEEDKNGKYVAVYLELQREYADVSATFQFALLDEQGNISPTTMSVPTTHTFTSSTTNVGYSDFYERTKLKETYVKDCYFVLSVKITLKDESCTGACWDHSSIAFLHEHESFQKFREENKRTDVSFDVDGEIFVAHRLILAAHSPVFEAELFGSMSEFNQECITIKEMMPEVFNAMLDFMYTGSLPVNEEHVDREGRKLFAAFVQHLLAAADRYALEILKHACEYELGQSISLNTVLSTLEVAEKHGCSELKKDCLWFILDKNNSLSLMLSAEYIKLMQNYPSLLDELKGLAHKM
ncbi:BTB/POZ and MATH domain-containing protein 2-like [Carex rostrata]